MAFKRGPNVVGLNDGSCVLYLDAANVKSYLGTGTVWTDLSKNNNNGTLTNGPTFSSDNMGSLVFDGVDDYIELGNILNFERINPFSICFWIKAGIPTTYLPVINKLTWGVGLSGWRILSDINGIGLTFTLAANHTVNDIALRIPSVLDNQWHFVCFTYDGNGVTNGMTGYMDGVYIISGGGGNLTSTTTSATPLGIFGGYGIYNSGAGRLSNASIYNRALSVSEVLQNYNALKHRFGL